MMGFMSLSPVVVFTASIVMVGCDGHAEENIDGRSGSTIIYVFLDRSDSELEYAYIIAPQGVFAQVSRFPGYTNRRFFLVAQLPGHLMDETRRWQDRLGEVKPPLIPDGPWFSRTAIPMDRSKDGETSYFKDSNGDIRKWLSALRGEMITDGHSVMEAPAWVIDDARIKVWLGMW